MPLHNSPATWQRLIDSVLGADLEPHVFVYLDDIIIVSIIVTQTFEKYLEIPNEVFKRLLAANLTVSQEKCKFCRAQLKYLGYVVDSNGLHVDPDKINAILNILTPRSVKDNRAIIGMASWYRRFIPNFATLVAPLTSLLCKNVKFFWSDDCERSLQIIKEHLVSAPVLSCPNFSLPFTVQTDASAHSVGSVLSQIDPTEGEKVICYLSRSLNKAERNYSTTERECLAVIFAVEHLRPYLEGTRFTVVTDHHSLVWLFNLKEANGRLARWILRLQHYDFQIVHRKGKEHVVPDAPFTGCPYC